MLKFAVGGAIINAAALTSVCAHNHTPSNHRIADKRGIQIMEKSEKYLLGLTNQGESRIEIYDLSRCENGELNAGARIWSVPCAEYNIAGLKLRRYHGELVVLTTYGATDCAMFSYESKETLWKTAGTANNPHSPELIPLGGGYIIAAAASDGDHICFFDPSDSSGKLLCGIEHEQAHGVLWDPEYDCLWAWGGSLLSKLKVYRADGELKVERIESYDSPDIWRHDLAPVYGHHSRIWCTAKNHVMQFDKTEKRFVTDYPARNM